MAFSFGSPQTMNMNMNMDTGAMSNSPQMQDGPDLVELQTEVRPLSQPIL